MTAARVTVLRNMAAVARFYRQPLSEIRRLKVWEFNVLLQGLPKTK